MRALPLHFFATRFSRGLIFLIAVLFATSVFAADFLVENKAFSLSFPTGWGKSPVGQNQTDTMAIVQKNGGLGGMALLTFTKLAVGVNPDSLNAAPTNLTDSNTKITKSTLTKATLGGKSFTIIDLEYETKGQVGSGGVTVPAKGKARIYNTVSGDHGFSLILLSILDPMNLPTADADAALATLTLKTPGTFLYRSAARQNRVQGSTVWSQMSGPAKSVSLLGRQFAGPSIR